MKSEPNSPNKVEMKLPNPAKLSPLWIVSLFVTFTETVLGIAVMKTTGNVQVSLTIFVIVFALLVVTAFFAVLWFKPHHFYAPADFGDMAPREFVDALRGAPKETVMQVAQVSRDPTDKTAVYRLLGNILDSTFHQYLILMAEKSVEIPYASGWSAHFGHLYSHGTRNRTFSQGGFNSEEFARKLDGTDFLEVFQNNGMRLRITDAGRKFAEWLIQQGKKQEFLKTPYGGWGKPFRHGPDGRIIEESDSTSTEPPLKS